MSHPLEFGLRPPDPLKVNNDANMDKTLLSYGGQITS